MSKLALLSGLFLAVAACESGGGGGGDDDGTTIDAGGDVIDAAPGSADAFVTPPGSFTIEWGPVTVQPGGENTQCVTKRLGNPGAIHVNQIHNSLNGVSHHLIVYKVADTTEVTTPVNCQPFSDTLNPAKGSPLMITQKHDEVLQLPAGVGFNLDANQMIRLEMHFVNLSDNPSDVSATSTFAASTCSSPLRPAARRAILDRRGSTSSISTSSGPTRRPLIQSPVTGSTPPEYNSAPATTASHAAPSKITRARSPRLKQIRAIVLPSS